MFLVFKKKKNPPVPRRKREGRVQTRQMEMDRAAERAALELLAIYPQYALRELLEEDLHALSCQRDLPNVDRS